MIGNGHLWAYWTVREYSPRGLPKFIQCIPYQPILRLNSLSTIWRTILVTEVRLQRMDVSL